MPDMATGENRAGRSMRITMLAVGTLGDVRPLLALGSGLRALGHQVTVATHELYAAEVRSGGMDFACIATNPVEVMQTSDGLGWLQSQSNPVKAVRAMSAMLR